MQTGQLSEQLLRQIADQQLRPCSVTLDNDLKVTGVAGQADWYGYDDLQPGTDAAEVFPFLHGIEAGDSQTWPLMETASGKIADICLHWEEHHWQLTLTDATHAHDQQQEFQQIANEARILNYRKDQLTEQLAEAKAEVEARRAEAEQANLLKSRFIATMSHEFRTPLTSILGYNQRLLDQASDKDLPVLQAVRRSAEHLLDLVNTLLDQGQLDDNKLSLNPAPFSLADLIADMQAIFTPLAQDKGLEMTFDSESLPSQVTGDVTRLRQIMVNLIGNAVKFTESGSVLARFRHLNDTLKLEVIDTGPGIPADRIAGIFLPFERVEGSRQVGAGLGLSISRRLAELMDGSLDAHSAIDEGSTFVLKVTAPTASTSPSLPQENGADVLKDQEVLLIEDDEDIAALISLHLEDAGLAVLHASDRVSAGQVLAGLTPGAIISDMNLPDGSGPEIVNTLRSSGFQGPIIALTAETATTARESALSAGCDYYLTKPVDFGELFATLREAVHGH